jgi:hypothetical protein
MKKQHSKPINHLFSMISKRNRGFNYFFHPLTYPKGAFFPYESLGFSRENSNSRFKITKENYRNSYFWIRGNGHKDMEGKVKILSFKENLFYSLGHQRATAKFIKENRIPNKSEIKKIILEESYLTNQGKESFDLIYNNIFSLWEPKSFIKKVKRGEHKGHQIEMDQICDLDIFFIEDDWQEYFKYFKGAESPYSFMIYFFHYIERKFMPELDDKFYDYVQQYLRILYGEIKNIFFKERPQFIDSVSKYSLTPRFYNINSYFFRGASHRNHFLPISNEFLYQEIRYPA